MRAGPGGCLPRPAPAPPVPAAPATCSLCASLFQRLSPGPGQCAGHRALGAGVNITQSCRLHVELDFISSGAGAARGCQQCSYLYVAYGETEARRGQAPCPQSHSEGTVGLRSHLRVAPVTSVGGQFCPEPAPFPSCLLSHWETGNCPSRPHGAKLPAALGVGWGPGVSVSQPEVQIGEPGPSGAAEKNVLDCGP